jgi:hypothetical protein
MHKYQHDQHKEHRERVIGGSKKSGICSEERSLISPTYAHNFICDFILGKPSEKAATQVDMFDMMEGAK